ncbi:MAG: hypothetical protein ACI8UO_001452 [Verrucomicrobiales bacterium]
MKSRKNIILGVLALIALASGFGVYWEWRHRNNSDTWFSSPTADRESISSRVPLERVIQSLPERHQLPSADFSMILESAGENSYSVVETGSAGVWAPEFEVVRVGPDQIARLPGGTTIELVAVATGLATSENVRIHREGGKPSFGYYEVSSFLQMSTDEMGELFRDHSKTQPADHAISDQEFISSDVVNVKFIFRVQSPEESLKYRFGSSLLLLFNEQTKLKVGHGIISRRQGGQLVAMKY